MKYLAKMTLFYLAGCAIPIVTMAGLGLVTNKIMTHFIERSEEKIAYEQERQNMECDNVYNIVDWQ